MTGLSLIYEGKEVVIVIFVYLEKNSFKQCVLFWQF